MKYRKYTNSRNLLGLIVILLMITSLPIAGINQTTTITTINIEDQTSILNLNGIDTDPPNTPISPDVTGDFDDPITIPMNEGGDFRRGSLEFELNSTWQFVFFKFNINESSPAKVTVNPAVGELINTNNYEVYFDVNSPNFEFIGYVTTFDTQGFPLEFEFPVGNPGDFILSVGIFDLVDFELTESFNLNVTIDHFAPGQLREGQNSDTFQSDPFNLIVNSEQTLSDFGYIDFNTDNVDLGILDTTHTDFIKHASLSIYGILNSAEYVMRSNNPDQPTIDDRALEYANIAGELFRTIHNNRFIGATTGDEGFYYQVDNGGNDYDAVLSDNVYALVAINEIIYFERYVFSATSYSDLNLNLISDMLEDAIIDLFLDTAAGNYEERVVITDWVPNDDNRVTSLDYLSATNPDNINTLESLALLAEVYYWGNPDFDTDFTDFQSEMVDIINYIETNFAITSFDGITLNNKIYAESFDGTNPSDDVTLIGNAHYVSFLASQAKGIGGTSTSDIGSLPSDYRDVMVDTLENVLKVFSDDEGGSNLLISRVNSSDFTDRSTTISNIDNVAITFAMNRLSVVFDETYSESDADLLKSSWKSRSLSGLSDLIDLLYQTDFDVFYPSYNQLSNLYEVDESTPQGNLLFSNLYIRAVLSDMLPVELESIATNNVIVGDQGAIELKLEGIAKEGTWIWFDPFKGIEVQVTISIPKFGYTETITLDLTADIFIFGGDVQLDALTFLYDVSSRGTYDVFIDVSSEGLILLEQQLELTALGQASLEFGLQQFDLTDSTFTTDLFFIDETSAILPALQVKGSLGQSFDTNQAETGAKYIRTDRTDASGKLEMTFNVRDLVTDGLINTTELFNQNPIPTFTNIKLFLNITNAGSFNLESDVMVMDVQVRLSRVNLRTSPTNLQLTQGTTESFSFSVTALDREQNPISNAEIQYSVLEVPSITNTVFTDNDGEATITFRDSDLFALSDLIIFLNQNRENQEVNATIQMTFMAENYPDKTITRSLSILPNELSITANPVQVKITESNFLQGEDDIEPLEVEVATEDSFSRVVNAFVNLRWENPEWNEMVDLEALGTHISPYTFSINPRGIEPGTYSMIITGVKDGLTSTVNIDAVAGDNNLGLSQVEQIVIPQETRRTIHVDQSTIENVIFTAISLVFALILTQGGRLAFDYASKRILDRRCPSCEEFIDKGTPVCKFCGRDTNFGKDKKSDSEPAKELNES